MKRKLSATTMQANFNKYADFVSVKKMQVNRFVLDFAKKLPAIKGAIVMDGRNQNTTRTLLEAKIIKNNQIHIPEIDPETYKIHCETKLANSYFCKLEDFLKNDPNHVLKNINLVFFDTMGMPEGNYTKKLYPMESLMMFLQKCQEKHIVVCLTYCLRSTGLFKGRKDMIEQIEKDYVLPCLTWCQYKVKSYQPYKYHRDSEDNRKTQEMLFMAFELEKDETINRNNVNFVQKTIKIKGKTTTVFSGYSPL